jgi:hypothetical protein
MTDRQFIAMADDHVVGELSVRQFHDRIVTRADLDQYGRLVPVLGVRHAIMMHLAAAYLAIFAAALASACGEMGGSSAPHPLIAGFAGYVAALVGTFAASPLFREH